MVVNYLIKILSDYQVAITLIISISGFFYPSITYLKIKEKLRSPIF